MGQTLFIVDGHSFIYQSFFGMPALTNADGDQVQACYAVTQLLIRLSRELRTDLWTVALDSSAPTFRHERFPAYKAHRREMPEPLRAQMAWIDELLAGFRVPCLRREGVEADDLVATVARWGEDLGYDVRIVSRDKDLQQILSDRVQLWNPKDGGLFGPRELWEKKGLRPDRVVEYLALLGDASDNIPGIDGIGPKTALKVLQAVGDLDEVLKDPPPPDVPAPAVKKIRTQADHLRLSRELVSLVTTVPVPRDVEFYRRRPASASTLRPLLRKLGFQRFLGMLDAMEEPAGGTGHGGTEAPADGATVPRPAGRYRLVDSRGALGDLIDRCRSAGRFALATEWTGLDPVVDRAVGLSIAIEEGEAFYLPLKSPEGADMPARAEVLALLKPLLEDPQVQKIGHHLKLDMQVLRGDGIELKGVAGDAMLSAYVVQPTRGTYSLAALAEELLHHTKTPVRDLLGAGGDTPLTIDELAPADLCSLAAENADDALRLHRRLDGDVDAYGVRRVLEELELPLIAVLADMEREGITLDPRPLDELDAEISATLARREREIYELVGEEFNLKSPKQLQRILFEKLELPRARRIKTGYSTSAEVLEELALRQPENPVPSLILEFRSLSKLLSTYIHALPRLVKRRTGRIHTDFSQTSAATGRLSSSDPNLQNIPVRSPLGRRIRQAFIPNHPGHVFLSADYSQIELRILAHVAQDPALVRVLREGQDIHRSVAARIHGVDPTEVSAEQRSAAKAVNFGVIYGMGAFGLARDLRISRAAAKGFIDAFFAEFPGVQSFIEGTITSAREKGEVRTLFGRRRPLPDIHSRIQGRRRRAEREAVNTVIQGSAADLIKKAMIEVHKRLRSQAESVHMLLQIHDELLFEVPRDQVADRGAAIQEWMSGILDLAVPIPVALSAGEDWYCASK